MNAPQEVTLRERLRAERDERRRLAELIHDGPVQYMAAVTQMLDAAAQALIADDVEAGRPIVERALAVAREASAELRSIVLDIEPASLGEAGFAAAVNELVSRVGERRDVTFSTDLPAAGELGEAAASGLYQIVRESIDQALRRGPPRNIEVHLHDRPGGGVVLEIVDDGAPERRQVVLDGLAERAAELNGTFDAKRRKSHTVTRVALPPSAAKL